MSTEDAFTQTRRILNTLLDEYKAPPMALVALANLARIEASWNELVKRTTPPAARAPDYMHPCRHCGYPMAGHVEGAEPPIACDEYAPKPSIDTAAALDAMRAALDGAGFENVAAKRALTELRAAIAAPAAALPKPRLTEWRHVGADWFRFLADGKERVGDEIVSVCVYARGDCEWGVWKPGGLIERLAGPRDSGILDEEVAKRLADEAARRWYALPDEIDRAPKPCPSAHLATPGDAPGVCDACGVTLPTVRRGVCFRVEEWTYDGEVTRMKLRAGGDVRFEVGATVEVFNVNTEGKR